MTLVIGSTDLEPGHVTAVLEPDGRLVRSGSGVVAVGGFGDWSDADIQTAVREGGGMQAVLDRFQALGAAHRFGLGPGLERIDGVFQASVSSPTRAGDGLVGRPIYVVGGNEAGLFVFKSQLSFEADYPVASGTVDMWGDSAAIAGGLLVGETASSVEVLELGSSGTSVRLAASGVPLDWGGLEGSIVPPPPPVLSEEVAAGPSGAGEAQARVVEPMEPVLPAELEVPVVRPSNEIVLVAKEEIQPPNPVLIGGGSRVEMDDGWRVPPDWWVPWELTMDGNMIDHEAVWLRMDGGDAWNYQSLSLSRERGGEGGIFVSSPLVLVPEPGVGVLALTAVLLVVNRRRRSR